VQAGKLRALAVLGPKRAAAMPEVPTAAESGMPWFDVQTWYGTLAPAGTPQNIIRYLNAEFVKIVNAPDVRQQRVADIKQQLSDGTYQVSSHVLAGKMLDASAKN